MKKTILGVLRVFAALALLGAGVAVAQTLQAPVKGFYTFEHSAESPHFEEPAKVREIMLQDVLHGTNSLADGK